MRRGVAEPRRDVAHGRSVRAGRHVVRHTQRAVAAHHDHGAILAEPLGQKGLEVYRIPGVGDVEIGVQRVPCQVDGAPNVISARGASPLVQEDGRARAYYGRAPRISAAWSSVPVTK